MNYYEELAKLTATELEAELRSLRSTADALPEVKGNPYTSAAYRSYRRSSWINECHVLLETERIEALNGKPASDGEVSK